MMQNRTAPASTNRVAIYIRVSTTHQIDKDSLPMQRQDLIAYAKLMLNTDDYVIFEDAGYSGKNTDRPKFQEMMSQIRQGAFSHLLVWKIDRISRNLLDFATMYKELKDLGVVFVSKNEQFDTSTAMGEAMLKIILVFAELERNMTSERVTATMISRASNGQWNGGRVPYGYNYDYETKDFSTNPIEAEIVHLIHDKYEEMRSLVRESRYLNEKGLRTRAGNLWNPVSLHIILHNIFYCGDYRYNVLKEGDRQKVKDESEWITVEDHHDSIISREQKERVIAMLDANKRLDRKRNTYQSEKYVHVFAGLLYCGNCGKPMGATPAAAKKDWQYSKYTCPTRRKLASACNGKFTSDPIVGEFVFNYVLNMLNVQKNFAGIHSPEELQAALLIGNTFSYIDHIDEDGLNDLFNMLSSGKIKGTVFGKSAKLKKKKVVSELSKLRNEKQKIERALDRLTKLYLYAEDAMPESEFIIQKSKLTEALDEVNEQIGFSNTDEWNQSVSDEEFVRRASEFIIAQKLTDRNYVSYKRLATSVDTSVIKTFVQSIIDSIIMDAGQVKQIIFKNGLSHTFIFK
ncbi:recombinase family protein [Coprococcus sp. BIOML-A1]|uniref:recombinase family protein n=1 Tax=unclassified Coprococcus TaxID=2684943 RepID=UPI001369CA18|nr:MULTISPECIES: recombinase family protein [unclassified Coprococcus]MZK38216.1 recombinase family protein [Coprococcus sp. BIOML-A1]MZK63167.1 recombinase family protein [Coprococcus sp. BIOML-A2]